MDYNKWICSEDIAAWLSTETTLSLEEQVICICAAPHRTISEKMEGIRELGAQSDARLEDCSKNGYLEGKIKAMENLMKRVYSDATAGQCLYRTEIYWRGEREWFQPEVLYKTAKEAIQDVKRRIEDTSDQTERKKENFYGVISVFFYVDLQGYRLTENLIIRHDGEIIYCLPDLENGDMTDYIGTEYFNAMRIPYFSGTIVEIEENPFMPLLKGVLVNMEAEPDEKGFADYSAYYQWILYPEYRTSHLTHGIGVAVLRDDYAPFSAGNPNVTFPYRQFIRKYNERKENEIWLEELSQLVRKDKRIFERILNDRRPREKTDINEERLKYVRGLVQIP